MKNILTTAAIIALAGCQNMNAESVSDAPTAQKTEECSIYDTRDWQASIASLEGTDEKYKLSVSGEVDLPSPAYQVMWKQGPMDRANPPSLRLKLTTENNSEGASIQVISPTKIEYTLETLVPAMKQVIISCGDNVIATVPVASTRN